MWFPNQCSGDGNSLFLSTRKFHSFLTHNSFETIWEKTCILNETETHGLLASCFKFRLQYFVHVKTIADVLFDCTSEQNRLLGYKGNLLFVPSWFQFFNVDATELDRPLLWIIESFDQRNQARFATSGVTSNSDGLMVFNMD